MHFLQLILAVFISAIVFPSKAFSGTVRGIISSKSQIAINPDGETYSKGDKLCIFTAKNKKIECGKVVSIKTKYVVIKLPSKKNIKKIKKGMLVTPEAATDEQQDATTAEEQGVTTDEQPVATKRSPSPKLATPAPNNDKFSLWMGWSPAIISPSKFNSVGYYATPSETPVTKLWELDEPIAKTIAGAAIQAAFPVGGIAVVPGLRYRIFTPNRVDTDYTPNVLNPYVSSLTTATAMGFFTDIRYLNVPMGSMFGFFGTGGLDVEMSSLKFKATKKDDTGATPETTLASADSSITVLSLRTGAGLNFIPFKPFGASLGLNVIFPVAEFGKKFSGKVEATETKGLQEPGDNLKAAIAHQKNKFGLDAQLSVLLAF